MDNQPTPPAGPNSTGPLAGNNPNINPNPNPVQPATPAAEPAPINAEAPTTVPQASDAAPEPVRKKSKKGLIATIICLIAVLLIGGGAFAAIYLINNQPANILASSMNNIFNAKQIEINGSVNFSVSDDVNLGVKSISLNFDDKAAGISNSTTATLNINFPDGTSAPAVELGEVMLNDGVLYIEASGLENFYEEAFRDNFKTILLNQIYNYQTNMVTDCSSTNSGYTVCTESYSDTFTIDPAAQAAASQYIDNVLDQVGEIISGIDNQWIEISIDDILDHEFFSSMPASSRQTISDSYKCYIGVLNQMPSYSGEISDLYNQNPFINMTSGQNSFYNISFDATNLAGYLNAAPNTKFAKDLAGCNKTDSTETTVNVKVEDIEKALQYMPTISAKFDGFIDHQLSELKLSGQNEYYSLSSDLKFIYPNNINISAPANSRPVMDIVEEVYQKVEEISKSLYAM